MPEPPCLPRVNVCSHQSAIKVPQPKRIVNVPRVAEMPNENSEDEKDAANFSSRVTVAWA